MINSTTMACPPCPVVSSTDKGSGAPPWPGDKGKKPVTTGGNYGYRKRTTGVEPATFGLGSRRSTN